MYANEVKQLKWISVTNWTELSKTRISSWGNAYVGPADVDNFVENVFKNVARQLNIPYSELEPILKEENSAFYSTKARLFQEKFGVDKTDDFLIALERMLRIPDVTAVPDDVNKSDVDKILNDFSDLTDIEKLEVLQRLGIVSVKVDFCK